MYYRLINDIASDFNNSLTEPQNLPRKVNFISGTNIIEHLDTPLVYTTNAKNGDPMVDFSKGSIPLISARFLELIQGAGVDNLQTFPAIVRSEKDKHVWENYFAVNILDIVECAILTKSIYTEIMPGHYIFDELAIDAKKAKGKLLFRLMEHAPTIIVHKNVLKYITKHDPDETLLGWEADEIIQ